MDLEELKEDEPDLSEETQIVKDVEEEDDFAAEGQDEWQQEAHHVEEHDVLKELASSDELEVNNFSHGFEVVKIEILLVFDVEDAGEMVVIEVNLAVIVLLDISDLFTNDDFGEVDRTVLNFNVSLFELL